MKRDSLLHHQQDCSSRRQPRYRTVSARLVEWTAVHLDTCPLATTLHHLLPSQLEGETLPSSAVAPSRRMRDTAPSIPLHHLQAHQACPTRVIPMAVKATHRETGCARLRGRIFEHRVGMDMVCSATATSTCIPALRHWQLVQVGLTREATSTSLVKERQVLCSQTCLKTTAVDRESDSRRWLFDDGKLFASNESLLCF